VVTQVTSWFEVVETSVAQVVAQVVSGVPLLPPPDCPCARMSPAKVKIRPVAADCFTKVRREESFMALR